MQTRMKSQATEERKKPKPSPVESQMATRSQLTQGKAGNTGKGDGVHQGAADKEEILEEIKRIQDNNNKSNDSSVLSDKMSINEYQGAAISEIKPKRQPPTIQSMNTNVVAKPQALQMKSQANPKGKQAPKTQNIAQTSQYVGQKRLREEISDFQDSSSDNGQQANANEAPTQLQSKKRTKVEPEKLAPKQPQIQKPGKKGKTLTRKNLEVLDEENQIDYMSDDAEKGEFQYQKKNETQQSSANLGKSSKSSKKASDLYKFEEFRGQSQQLTLQDLENQQQIIEGGDIEDYFKQLLQTPGFDMGDPYTQLLLQTQLLGNQNVEPISSAELLQSSKYSKNLSHVTIAYYIESEQKKRKQHDNMMLMQQLQQQFESQREQDQMINEIKDDEHHIGNHNQGHHQNQVEELEYNLDSPERIIQDAEMQLRQMTPEQQIAYLTDSYNNSAVSEKAKQTLKQLSLAKIQNITDSQMTEIQTKLQMEREQKQEIINQVSSQRNSFSPDNNHSSALLNPMSIMANRLQTSGKSKS
ncbi:UNKNOWN [Stylonychia lemnae]|uniref:Uncharacterized protein n=1 Tax=Stylonychia lemnae TaxID=5949 RepID=A0A078B5Q2_STYLE|nr:UNKNOWN [Stylonychia lemnae]|eukprot:CDW89744.1 UNKNOWN [Stylonychia lemnae]